MSNFAAATSASDLCPCHLTQDFLREFNLVGEGAVCTAWRKGSNKQVRCGELFVDHPTAGISLFPITFMANFF